MKFATSLCTALVWITLINTMQAQTTAIPTKQSKESIQSFSQWCKQKLTLPKETKHTVEILLEKADTQDCDRAEQELKKLSELGFLFDKISDIKPLAGLTNLTQLYLGGNKISDIKPLAGLTNLTQLSLSGNQISDIKPLAGLTNLTKVDLTENQISDIKPLSGLTNLIVLYLQENPIENPICPVKTESVCSF